jgi:hypothetical protein
MTTTLPSDPLLDELKKNPAEEPLAPDVRRVAGAPSPKEIGMAQAQPWPGGPLDAMTGVRWYSQSLALVCVFITRKVRQQVTAPIYRFHVDETGISLQPRRPWVRPVFFAIGWMFSRDLMPRVEASWSDISAIRRTRKSLTTWSVIEFCVHGEWVGVATFRTGSLDRPWSAVVHQFRASRTTAPMGGPRITITEGVAVRPGRGHGGDPE